MTVFEGTLCAPMALRTICSTVAIFTNAVTLMNANGRSDTSASATTSAMGRESRSSERRAPGPLARRRVGLGRARRRFARTRKARASTSANGAPRAALDGGEVASPATSPSLVNPPSPTPTTNTCSPTFTR